MLLPRARAQIAAKRSEEGWAEDDRRLDVDDITDSITLVRGAAMAQLIVRGLPEDVVQRLRERAAAHGHSAEEEHRQILRHTLMADDFVATLRSIPDVGDDGDFERSKDLPRENTW